MKTTKGEKMKTSEKGAWESVPKKEKIKILNKCAKQASEDQRKLMREVANMKDLKEQIEETLYSYRVQADMAYSEVTDVHTQKEYEEALKRISNTHILAIQKLISSAIDRTVEEERKKMKFNVGYFRQWINEELKPQTLITNEDIEHWIFTDAFVKAKSNLESKFDKVNK